MNAFYRHYTKYNEIESLSFPVNTHVEYENTNLITQNETVNWTPTQLYLPQGQSIATVGFKQ